MSMLNKKYNCLTSDILCCSLVPKVAPTDLGVVEKSSNSITVKWQPIPGNLTNGPLLGYKVEYTKFYTGEKAYITTLMVNSPTQVKISNLEKGTYYAIRIAGLTEGGVGPFSKSVREFTKMGKYPVLFLVQIFLSATCNSLLEN